MPEHKSQAGVVRMVDTGMGATMQDHGRHGWRRFGVPVSGWMDHHAAVCANGLLSNASHAPVLEFLLQGAVIEVMQETWLALCGARLEAAMPMWRAYKAHAGEVIRLSRVRSGVWSYLAVEGGWDWPVVFGSASYYGRGGLGMAVENNTVLGRRVGAFRLDSAVSGRFASRDEIWDFEEPPVIPVWRGPQWDSFDEAYQRLFLETEWEISPQSDRVGYRLKGARLAAGKSEIASEPVRPGSIQVPGGGEPIVTMKDGPTVGGYPKIAVVDGAFLARVAQCRPGQKIRFEMKHED